MSEEANLAGEYNQDVAGPPIETENEASYEQSNEQHNVPLSALQSERAERQRLAEELQMMKDHLALMDSRRQEPKEQPKNYWDEVQDDDIPTYGDLKKLFNDREKHYESRISEMQMAQRHPDYAEVIRDYLPDVISKNPSLRKSLEQSQDYELAYYLAKNSEKYLSENKKAKKNADAERILQNTQQGQSLSSTGAVSPINTAKRYRDMSDDDFRKEVNKNLGYF